MLSSRLFGLSLLLLILPVTSGGCTVRAERPGADDAGFPWADVISPIHPCLTDGGTEADIYNCGSCGNVCDLVISDRCMGGFCSCGLDLFCGPHQECRFGECRDVDLSGDFCEFDDECFAGYACIRGHCSFVRCVPEVCDTVDNDCDGVVDGTTFSPLSRWCYDRDIPATMMLNPPCERGVQVCDIGTWTECEGAVSPVLEAGVLACDDLDNDCDGCPDGVRDPLATMACLPVIIEGFDIVYAIDISGSMGRTIAAVKVATNTFSAMYRTNPDFRFGLVVFPSNRADGTSEVLLRLSDFTTFETALTPVTTGGGGSEPNWDVVAQLGTGELDMGWRRGTIRIIILFSDEPGQSYTTPRNSESTMCAALTHGEVLAVVERTSMFFQFDECGLTFELTDDPVAMVMNLSTIIADPCAH